MNTVEQVELSDVFQLVSKPKFVLGTTYTLSLAFFESVLWQYINRSNLISCLIIADPNGYDRSITEGGALQRAGQDYQVVRAPIPACFHPKVWIFVGDGEAVLLVGSGNLTQAGFVKNAEMFDVVTIDAENPASATLLTSMQTFTSGLSGMWPKSDTWPVGDRGPIMSRDVFEQTRGRAIHLREIATSHLIDPPAPANPEVGLNSLDWREPRE